MIRHLSLNFVKCFWSMHFASTNQIASDWDHFLIQTGERPTNLNTKHLFRRVSSKLLEANCDKPPLPTLLSLLELSLYTSNRSTRVLAAWELGASSSLVNRLPIVASNGALPHGLLATKSLVSPLGMIQLLEALVVAASKPNSRIQFSSIEICSLCKNVFSLIKEHCLERISTHILSRIIQLTSSLFAISSSDAVVDTDLKSTIMIIFTALLDASIWIPVMNALVAPNLDIGLSQRDKQQLAERILRLYCSQVRKEQLILETSLNVPPVLQTFLEVFQESSLVHREANLYLKAFNEIQTTQHFSRSLLDEMNQFLLAQSVGVGDNVESIESLFVSALLSLHSSHQDAVDFLAKAMLYIPCGQVSKNIADLLVEIHCHIFKNFIRGDFTRAMMAYDLVNRHKYRGLIITSSLVETIADALVDESPSSFFNLVALCLNYSKQSLSVSLVSLLLKTCRKLGDTKRATALWRAVIASESSGQGILAELPDSSIDDLEALGLRTFRKTSEQILKP